MFHEPFYQGGFTGQVPPMYTGFAPQEWDSDGEWDWDWDDENPGNPFRRRRRRRRVRVIPRVIQPVVKFAKPIGKFDKFDKFGKPFGKFDKFDKFRKFW